MRLHEIHATDTSAPGYLSQPVALIGGSGEFPLDIGPVMLPWLVSGLNGMDVERMGELGIEFVSAFAMPPPAMVNLAADLGCRHVSLLLGPFRYNPDGFAPWSLRDDPVLRRDTKATLARSGVNLSLAEGFAVREDANVRDLGSDLDIVAELGGNRVSTLGMDPDRSRCLDQFAVLAEMAGERGLSTQLEFVPYRTIASLSDALAARRHVGREDFRLTVDTMHFARSGGTPEDLRQADPEAIGYAQLCDAPLVSAFTEYMHEASTERLPPGEGELPLFDILCAMPPVPVIGLEVPMLARAEAGEGPHQRLARVVDAARDLLDRVDQAGASARASRS